MRLLYFNHVAAPVGGGRNQYVLDVCTRLKAAGHTVGLVHAKTPRSVYKGTGYVFNHLGEDATVDDEVLLRLEAILEDFNPDVIQLHGMDNIALHEPLAKHAPTVRFVHNHSPYCSGGDMTWAVPRRICELAHGGSCLRNHYVRRCGSLNPMKNMRRYKRVTSILESFGHLDGIQVASETIRDNLLRNGIPGEKIRLIPLYAPVPAVPRRPSLHMARRVVLHAGGLVRNKGVWLLLKSVQHLPGDVELVFAGGGDQQAAVESYVKRNRLGERVRIMGEVDSGGWSELFHQATVLVFPSRWNEPVGLCGLHAMAHGKPVVAFEAGGVKGWLQDKVTGIAVEFDNRRSFMEKLVGLLERPNRIAEYGENALHAWEKGFRPRHHIGMLEDYYRWIVERRGGSASENG